MLSSELNQELFDFWKGPSKLLDDWLYVGIFDVFLPTVVISGMAGFEKN